MTVVPNCICFVFSRSVMMNTWFTLSRVVEIDKSLQLGPTYSLLAFRRSFIWMEIPWGTQTFPVTLFPASWEIQAIMQYILNFLLPDFPHWHIYPPLSYLVWKMEWTCSPSVIDECCFIQTSQLHLIALLRPSLKPTSLCYSPLRLLRWLFTCLPFK